MEHDLIIIGAGPAGLAFARALADTGLNIAVVESQKKSAIAAPVYDGREIALTHLSKKIMREIGIWQSMPEKAVSLIKTAKVLNSTSPYALVFDHTEAGAENLGFMAANNVIRKAAYDSVKNIKNIHFYFDSTVTAAGSDDRQAWVRLAKGKKLRARLLVAADSRFSSTRRMMGLSASQLDFGRTCIVCTMSITGKHDDTAYECFHDDRTLAVLPLVGKNVSVVITLPAEEAATLLATDEAAFAADIERRTSRKFGRMRLTSQLHPYPLVASLAHSFYSKRFALVGDAAVGMHPVTAHGFNLGLRGAYTLAENIRRALKNGEDIGNLQVLESYDRRHRRASLPLYHGTNALVRLYTSHSNAARLARHALLRLGNRVAPARRLIMRQLTEIAS